VQRTFVYSEALTGPTDAAAPKQTGRRGDTCPLWTACDTRRQVLLCRLLVPEACRRTKFASVRRRVKFYNASTVKTGTFTLHLGQEAGHVFCQYKTSARG
jgi:hypothetical protein